MIPLGFILIVVCLRFQVACTSMKSSEVHIFDIGYISSDPVEASFYAELWFVLLLHNSVLWEI